MTTPDISINFDLAFEGYSDQYEALIEVDWSKYHKHNSLSAGGSVYFVGADVETFFDQLRDSAIINFIEMGHDQNMENLTQAVYQKLLKMFFDPVSPEELPEEERGDLMDDLIRNNRPQRPLK